MSITPRISLVLLASLLSITALTPHTSLAGFTQTYQATGNLQVEVTGAAGLNPPAMGTVTLSSIPTGTIKQAYFYATQTNNTLGLDLTFNSTPKGITSPYQTEALLITVSTYRWDVTANIIPAVTSYSFSVLDGSGLPIPVPGVALVVVWEDASTEPIRTVTIVDGVKQVGESGSETESMMFTAQPA
jgi:hypothetical protein